MIPLIFFAVVAHSWEYGAGINDGAGFAWADFQDYKDHIGNFMIPQPTIRECVHATDDGYCQAFVKGYLDTEHGILNGTLKK